MISRECPFHWPSGASQGPGHCLAQVVHPSRGVFLGSWAPVHSRLVPPTHCCWSSLSGPTQPLGSELCGNLTLPPLLFQGCLGTGAARAVLAALRDRVRTSGRNTWGTFQLRGKPRPVLGQAAEVGEGKGNGFPHLGTCMRRGWRPHCLSRHCRGCLGIKYRHEIPDQDLRL